MSRFGMGLSATLSGADGTPCFEPSILNRLFEREDIQTSILPADATWAKPDAKRIIRCTFLYGISLAYIFAIGTYRIRCGLSDEHSSHLLVYPPLSRASVTLDRCGWYLQSLSLLDDYTISAAPSGGQWVLMMSACSSNHAWAPG